MDKQAIIKYYVESGEGTRKVGERFNISKDAVNKIVKEAGVVRKNKFLSYNKEYFKTIDTEHKAYWLGFIMADGNVYDFTKQPKYSLDIALNSKDKTHLEKLKENLEFTGEIKERVIKKKYPTSRLQVHGKEFVMNLVDKGCTPNKTMNVTIPNLPTELIKHFIRGYFDGDGSITIYDDGYKDKLSISLCCGNEEFLNEVQSIIIKELNLTEVKIYSDKRSNLKEYRKARQDAFKILTWLYKDATVYLDRKYEMYNKSCRLYSETI